MDPAWSNRMQRLDVVPWSMAAMSDRGGRSLIGQRGSEGRLVAIPGPIDLGLGGHHGPPQRAHLIEHSGRRDEEHEDPRQETLPHEALTEPRADVVELAL